MDTENKKFPYYNNSMTEHLGIKFLSCENNVIIAEMPVDHRTCQPYGILNGGASLALAEITAGYGSMAICGDDRFPAGMQVSANHISSVKVGHSVLATGKLIHKGVTTHVWNVDVTTPGGRLVSSVRVVNFIKKIK